MQRLGCPWAGKLRTQFSGPAFGNYTAARTQPMNGKLGPPSATRRAGQSADVEAHLMTGSNPKLPLWLLADHGRHGSS